MKSWEKLTRKEKENFLFKHTHRDYKGGRGNDRGVLMLRNGGTTIVNLKDLTTREIDGYKARYERMKESK